MALPTSGTITLDEIHVEAGGTTNTIATINDADIRALIGKAAGVTMSFDEWYGASGRVAINLTISSNTNNYNIVTERGGTYDAGNTDVTLTINSGITVGSTSTFTPALNTGSSWTTGDTITIINNGTIKGLGGNGGDGADAATGVQPAAGGNGSVGGRAVRCQFTTTFTNNGSVYGGGGGGGGGGGAESDYKGTQTNNAGSGGGGGAGVNAGSGGSGGTASGTGIVVNNNNGGAGSSGSATAGGAGGTGASGAGAVGGAGGGLGADGSAGNNGVFALGVGQTSLGGTGGTRGFYEFNSKANINGGAGIGGVVGGRSSQLTV